CFLVVWRWTDRPLLFGFVVGAVMLVSLVGLEAQGKVIYRQRSFFGIHRVVIDPTGTYVQLYHGGTIHGMQKLGQAVTPEPLTYSPRSGPIGQLFEVFATDDARRAVGPNARHVAVVGLGAGSLAYYRRPGQEMTFYEIDPAVRRIAENPAYF